MVIANTVLLELDKPNIDSIVLGTLGVAKSLDYKHGARATRDHVNKAISFHTDIYLH